MLQEKLIKINRAIKTFKELLSDRKVKNTIITQEIAQYWPEIESFLKDSKIVFEFELYFPVGEKIKNEIDLSTIKSVDTNLFKFMREYFQKYNNMTAWRQIHQDVMDDDSVLDTEEYLNKFNTALEVFLKYPFSSPAYGFSYNDGNTIIIYQNSIDSNINYSYVQSIISQVFTTDKIKLANNVDDKRDFPEYWFIEEDSSLRSKYKGHQPVEIVTPYLSISEAQQVLEKFKKEVHDQYDCITDHTTGFHINSTYSGEFDALKLIIMSNELLWLKKFDREFNDYCESQYQYVIDQFKTLTSDTFYDIVDFVKIKEDKYSSFNFLKSKMIEFRGPGDDYLGTKFEHSQQVLDWFLFLMTIGLNKKFFRQEYISKVMKLHNKYHNSVPEPKNVIAKYVYRFVTTDHIMPMTMPYMLMSCYVPEVIEHPQTVLVSNSDRALFLSSGYTHPITNSEQYMNKVKDMLWTSRHLCNVLIHRMTNIPTQECSSMLSYALKGTGDASEDREEFKQFVLSFVNTLNQIKFNLEILE
jgi:hypothetical protein